MKIILFITGRVRHKPSDLSEKYADQVTSSLRFFLRFMKRLLVGSAGRMNQARNKDAEFSRGNHKYKRSIHSITHESESNAAFKYLCLLRKIVERSYTYQSYTEDSSMSLIRLGPLCLATQTIQPEDKRQSQPQPT